MDNMGLKQILLESTDEETVLKYLSDKIMGTEWENNVFLAGGAVRDEIMGKKPKDLDFLVLGSLSAGIDFSTWLSKELNIYKEDSNPVIFQRFGTSKLSLNKNNQNLPSIELEFVAPRKETYTPGSRKPSVIEGTLKDDVMRRDLTINSLLKNISTNEIIDLTGKGIDDIKNGVIQTTSNPDVIFKEDPLRMLRTIRFCVKYDFKINDDVFESIKRNANLIDSISKERINDELNKILVSPNPSMGFELMKQMGLLKYVIEELELLIDLKQNEHHDHDVFGHTLKVLSNTSPDLKTRLMALFHDIGKVLTKTVTPDGSVHFYEHEKAGEDMVRDIMGRLKYPNDLINSVALGVRNHMKLKHGGDDGSKISNKTLRKFKISVGDNLEYILDLMHADNISHSEKSSMPNQIKILKQRIDNLDIKLDKLNLKLPINGTDLLNMGIKQGPIFREILELIQDAWYENPDITKEESIDIVNKFRLERNLNEIRVMFKKLV